ncbi:MAG: sugar ABC transporter permease [Bacillota bacterium]
MEKKRITYLTLLPATVVFLLLALYPTVEAVWTSLNSYNLTKPWLGKSFLFLGNYIHLLSDSRFWLALLRAMQFVAASVVISFMVGLAIALLLHRARWFKGFFRIAFLVPMVVAPAITALNFKFMYNYNLGIINHILELSGLGRIDLLGNPSVVLWSIIAVDIWQWTPLVILVLLAGLESLPREPYEAALIDGANRWQVFRSITLPLLNKFITITLVIRIMDALKVYEAIHLMSAGGPGTASETLNIYLARVGFNWFDMGYASALGVISLYLTLFLAWFLVKRTGAFATGR